MAIVTMYAPQIKGHRRDVVERFWERVHMLPDLPGCWLYDGHQKRGYAHIRLDDYSLQYVHRFSYELHHGPIPEGMKVLHRCDTPLCVRPDHLWLGTQAANMADMAVKGRASNGTTGRKVSPLTYV